MAGQKRKRPVVPNDADSQVLAELTAIKRLLIAALLRGGATQADVAKALGVAQGTVSKMMGKPKGV